MTENKEIKKRSAFRSRFGIIAAAAGSAIGLGNIWRFPYMTGQNGGAAFILIYLGIIFAIGVPLMISEFIIGRQSQRNPVGAFKVLKPNSPWKWVGVLGVIASVLILAFYSTVAGWTLEYIKIAVANQYHNLDAEGLRTLFSNFTNNSFMSVFWQVVFIVLTVLIVLAGVEKGIERYTKLLMPLLLLIIIVLCIRSVTLPGASKGLSFLFNPDFSKIDGGVVLNALGQAFFSLSLGMGTMITYGSYIKRSEKLPNIAVSVSIADTLIAVLAGVAIFPAVFALGFTADEGTGLVFIVLPQVFNSLPAGQLFAITFFILLFIAAITSSISLLEVVTAYLIEERKVSRTKSAIIGGGAALAIGILCTLSLTDSSALNIGKFSFFDFTEYLTSNIMLPLGGLFIVLFIGWAMSRKHIKEQLNVTKTAKSIAWYNIFMFILRFIAPVAIILIFLYQTGLIKF